MGREACHHTSHSDVTLGLSLGTASSGHGMEREMLEGRAADSDMWKLSSNVDPLCFRIFVFSPPIRPLSPSFFSIQSHFFSSVFLLSSITFHDLT